MKIKTIPAINLADSAATRNLKIGTGSGEKRLYIGNTPNEDVYDDFFGWSKEGDEVSITITKLSLIEYLIEAEGEFKHPSQKYANDITSLYDSLMNQTLAIKDDIITFIVIRNVDPRRYYIRPQGDYDYLRNIALPILTKFYFIKYINVDENGDETSEIHLFPRFKKVVLPADIDGEDDKEDNPHPLQQIFYGAPGTGKSYETNETTRKYPDTIRTTFHPDSDYSTFVGSYKPTTTEEYVYGLNGDKTICLKDTLGNPLKTSKIDYRFVKQAFLKAYILAWQKMCVEDTPLVGPLTFTNKAVYTIKEVDETQVTYQKEHSFPKKLVESEWNKIWSKGSFVIPTGKQSGKSIQHAIIQWIYNLKGSKTTSNDFEAGWSKLIGDLKPSKKIEVKKTKVYTLTYNSDEEYVNVQSQANAKRPTIQKCYEGKNHRDSVEGIAELLRAYNLSTFEEAWIRLTEDVKKGVETNINVDNTIAEQFLVIEEINRGNCAQIFGDIFQLLDRTDNGYSQYPIEADEDIKKALLEEDPADGLSFGGEGLKLSDGIIDELNEIFNESSDDIVGKICRGQVLVLPKNLHIWATMNTSDQSLFPIDSAFKRRWDWEYKPIVNHLEENWKIQIGGVDGVEYDWWTFLEEVNQIINTLTSSEDKKLGYFFAKAKGKVVDTNTLVNKVFFYLWKDVFKDYELSTIKTFPKIKDTKDNKERPFAFGDFFNDKTGKIEEEVVKQFLDALMPKLTEITTETTDEKEE